MARTGKIYQQLMDSIRNKIISGELTINEKLESERVMSEKYGINRMTVRNALKHLEEEGVLESRRGSGTYVKAIPRMEEKIGLGDESEILSVGLKTSAVGCQTYGCSFAGSFENKRSFSALIHRGFYSQCAWLIRQGKGSHTFLHFFLADELVIQV